MGHNRKLALSAVSLVKGRIRNSIAVMVEVNNDLESLLMESKFFVGAPFKWVGLMLRYGTRTMLEPEYDTIDSSDGELPIAVELEMKQLMEADRDELKRLFTIATLEALIAVAREFNLPSRLLTERRAVLGDL